MKIRGKILLAGDIESGLKNLLCPLQERGHRCSWVDARESAASLLKSAAFDLFICGLEHHDEPDMDLVGRINSVNQGIPVLIVTRNPSVESAARAVRLGVKAYLIEPFDLDEVLELVEQNVSVCQERRACSSVLERMEGWTKEVSTLEKYLNQDHGEPDRLELQKFVPLTIGRILGSVLDLKTLLDAVAEKETEYHTCHLLACPRLNACEGMLRETIATIEKTKNYFKSRDLHELRVRLEQFLKDHKN
ncbi:hypothetical protein LLG95_14105 [bacterium]|nr:hypothetical protein [bacterium]